jgi:hypothetical protein
VPNLPTTRPPALLAQGMAVRSAQARGHQRRQSGNDRIASASDIEHLARMCADMLFTGGVKQCHALFAAGQQHGVELERLAQVLCPGAQIGFVAPGADDLLQFGPVGGDDGGAAVAGVVAALGVDEYRFAGAAGSGHHAVDVRQTALAVVGEQYRLMVWQQAQEGRRSVRPALRGRASFSKSSRSSCCWRPMTRSLTVVCSPASRARWRLDAGLAASGLRACGRARRRRPRPQS